MKVVSKKNTIVIASVVVIFGVVVAVATNTVLDQNTNVLSDNTAATELRSASDVTSGVSISYPVLWQSKQLTAQDIEDGFIFRFESYDPPALVSIRKESGLQTAAALSRLDVLDLLISNVAKSYPTRFEGYSLEAERSTEIDGKQAKEVVFTYVGPSSEKVKQKLLIIKQNSGEAVYISMQTKESDYGFMESLFTQIGNSILVQ